MSFDVNIYDQFVFDLAMGAMTSGTIIDGLLLASNYTFNRADADVTTFGYELSGGSYSRFNASAVFVVVNAVDEVQYQNTTPQVEFTPFTATDWQYVVLFNHVSNHPYLCIDTGVVNHQVSSGFTLEPGPDPYIRLVAP
jgi:hypothetical protein